MNSIVNRFLSLVANGVITSVCAITTIVVSICLHFNNRNKDIAKDRLLTVYEPLFELLENFLFKYEDSKQFKSCIFQVKKILHQHRSYSGNNLVYAFEIFEKSSIKMREKNYNIFCDVFLKNYNKLCAKIGVKKISNWQRCNNRWMTKKRTITFMLLQSLKALALSIVVLSVVLFTIIIITAIIIMLLSL